MTQAAELNTHLTPDALEAAIARIEPRTLMLPTWLVQRIITLDRGPLGVLGNPRVPAWMTPRQRLLELDRDNDLDLDPLPKHDHIILLARPEPELLDIIPAPMELLQYWRLLFHARVRGSVHQSLHAQPDSATAVRGRIIELGAHIFNEARFVLQRDRYLPMNAADSEAYAQFAALFLELVFFRPETVKAFFPSIHDPQAIVRKLAADVDAERILEATHLLGAAGPVILPDDHHSPATSSVTRKRRRSHHNARRSQALLEAAQQADQLGNDVRAAILRMHVCRAGGENIAGVYGEALRDVDQLVARLQAAIGLDDPTARRWRAWLAELLENAAGGWWNAEGRFLYDLQKVCVYHEREIYSVGVIEWFLEFCRRPLRRPQPYQRAVLMIKALRSSLRRSSRVRLGGHGRAELQTLIGSAIQALEDRLRHQLRPRVEEALDVAQIVPRHPTEIIAREKLAEELIDSITERGHLSFSQVRDAISRSQMKLEDLTQAKDLVGGDQLLKLDAELETRLDAVYRRGEIYLRLFHRTSSLLFATGFGRFLTLWVLLTVAGAYLLLETLDHTVGKLIIYLGQVKPGSAAAKVMQESLVTTSASPVKADAAIFTRWWLVIPLSLFLMGIFNVPAFRAWVWAGMRKLGKGLHALFVRFPRWIANWPFVKWIFNSRIMRLFGRYALKPAIAAGVAWNFVPDEVSDRTQSIITAGVFLAVNLFLNSRIGRAIEQALIHTFRTTLARFGWEILVILGRGIVQIFERILETIDRLLYAVDELLRFRAGQGKLALVTKATLGVFWFYIAYVTRFGINLLLEPQINPVKHFPVVTVSHKLLLPTYQPLGHAFMTVGISAPTAFASATAIIWCIPGIFGFLAWEFKENWRLYRANRSGILRKRPMGSHGETLAQLLRPGFHSGTIPKLFHRLRKAHLAASSKVTRHQFTLEHIDHSVTLFFQRELIALLNRHPLFAATPLALESVELSVTRILVSLSMSSTQEPNGDRPPPTAMLLAFEQRGGWIIASIERPGFIHNLSDPQSRLFAAALVGFYKMSGVDIVAEQLRDAFAPRQVHFDLRGRALLVWPAHDLSVEAAYDLAADGPMTPNFATDPRGLTLPILEQKQILLSYTQVSRTAWMHLWESPTGPAALPPTRTLPPTPSPAQPLSS